MSASAAAVKVSTIQNPENVVSKVVKMFQTSAKKTALLKSCIKEDISKVKEKQNVILSAYVKPGLYRTPCIDIGKALMGKKVKIMGKKFLEVCPKTVQNALKWPLQYVNFQKFSGEHAPGPPGVFFCSSTCFKLILPEKKYASKNVEIWCPFLEKISDYASNIKHFQSA